MLKLPMVDINMKTKTQIIAKINTKPHSQHGGVFQENKVTFPSLLHRFDQIHWITKIDIKGTLGKQKAKFQTIILGRVKPQ